MEHFGKYASLSNSKDDKNKSLFKSNRSTKTKLLKLTILKFMFRHLYLNTDEYRNQKTERQSSN